MRAGDNPFRMTRLHAVRFRPEAAGLTWDKLLDRLRGLDRRAAVVGPKGSGKTTLVGELAQRLGGQGFRVRSLRLGADAPPRIPDAFLRDLDGEAFLLLDGAEQLGRAAWRRFLRASAAAGGLVITRHTPGGLPTLVEAQTSPALLADIVADLLPPEERPAPADLDALYAAHRGNLRDCLRALYDRWAGDDPLPAG